MPDRPEELHPALVAAFNAGDLEGVLALYAPDAVFVLGPGRVTNGPAELRAALRRLIELDARLDIEPRSFVRSGDVVLVVGRFTHAGRRRDGTPFEIAARFADVLCRRPDGRWLMAVDDGFDANGEP